MLAEYQRGEMRLLFVTLLFCEAIFIHANFCGGNLECQLALQGKRILRSGVFMCTKKHQYTCVDKVCVCGRPDKCKST